MFVLIFIKSYENGFSIENSYQTALYESREEAVKVMKESAEKHVNSYLETEDDERVEFTEYGDLGEKGLGLDIEYHANKISVTDDCSLSNHYRKWEWVVTEGKPEIEVY